ncbi:MAG: anhydro-N-acetylmuramic acid kinase [Rhodospirillaceae bacterium]|nr:anhydro-N-acetylmuramic acid kinase [Rhodospirillaceae bacterium]
MQTDFALGLMSGTSLDGIDAALIRTDGETISDFGPWATTPYGAELGQALRRLVDAGPGMDEAAAGVAQVEAALTEAHAGAVRTLLAEAGLSADQIRVVGFHGHTLWHDPERGRTRQIGDGALLAARLGIDVVNDFRSADMAAGGQGAPLAPLYHAALARGSKGTPELPLAVLNLGGVANITWIGAAQRLLAFDTGPASALIDDLMLRRCGEAYDRDGKRAAAGQVSDAVLAVLLDDAYFSAPPPKSLDRNAFDAAPIEVLSTEDGAATLVAFTARTVALGLALCPEQARRILVTGGGRHNPTLMAALQEYTGVVVEPVEAVGWRGDALEAEAFAFLAVRALQGRALSVPETTGVARPLTGGVLHKAG